MDINLPHVVAEVSHAFTDYERALLANELTTLDAYFWNAEHTVRYGVAENLHVPIPLRAIDANANRSAPAEGCCAR